MRSWIVFLLILTAPALAQDEELAYLTQELGWAESVPERLETLAQIHDLLQGMETEIAVPSGLYGAVVVEATDPDVALRRLATTILGLTGDERCVAFFRNNARDEVDYEVRRRIIGALGRFSGVEPALAINYLTFSSWKSHDYRLRELALSSWLSTGGDLDDLALTATNILHDDPYPTVRLAAAEVLQNIEDIRGSNSFFNSTFEAYLNESDLDVKGALLTALGFIGLPDALPIITEALEQPSLFHAALAGLGYINSRESRKLLREAFWSGEATNEDRLFVVRSLGRLRDDGIIELAEWLLENDPTGDETEVLEALALHPAPGGIGLMEDLLQRDPPPPVDQLVAACGLLGKMAAAATAAEDWRRYEDAVQALQEVYERDFTGDAYDAATAALVKIVENAAQLEPPVRRFRGIKYADALAALGNLYATVGDAGTAGELLDYLGEEPPPAKTLAVIDVLGRLGYAGAVPLLSIYARETRPGTIETSVAALRALGRIGDRNAAPVFAEVLEDTGAVPARLAAAAEAAVDAGDPSLVYPLMELLERGDDWGTRAAAARAIGALGSKDALPTMGRAMTSDPSKTVRGESFLAYCRLTDEDGLPILFTYLAGHDIGLGDEALGALRDLFNRLGGDTVEELLTHPEPEARRLIVWYLAKRAEPGDRELVEGVLGDPNLLVNVAAAEGLGLLGDPASAPVLLAAFKETFDTYYASGKDLSFNERNVNLLRRTIEDAFHALGVDPTSVTPGTVTHPDNFNEVEEAAPERMIVVVGALRLRDAPSTATGAKIGLLSEGQVVEVFEVSENWARVRTADDEIGWACIELEGETFMTPTDEPLIPEPEDVE
ncbi:HEAT repeat domain-containing protein [bacterium]|nr:HEAT repeat domain-containing protein [bacterium]